MTPQQIEAMKLALEALKKCHYYMINAGLPNQSLLNEAFTAYKALEGLKEHAMQEVQRLGQEIEQEPDRTGMVYYKNDACKAKDAYADDCICWTKAQPEQEPVAWPCLIDSADFSENTITLVMQCEDYKVSAGTHWLSTTSPQRTERNFCERCGKRTKDIHTCTPPRENT